MPYPVRDNPPRAAIVVIEGLAASASPGRSRDEFVTVAVPRGRSHMTSITGSCLCGTLKYEVNGSFVMMMNCHGSMCRKHHGAPFATFAATPIDHFRWVAGEEAVEFYDSSAHGKRGFCP